MVYRKAKIIKITLLLILSSILLLISFSLLKNLFIAKDIKKITSFGKDINVTAHGLEIIEKKDEDVKWILRAEAADLNRSKSILSIHKPHLEIFRDGEFFIEINADSGSLNTQTRDVIALGKIEINSKENYRLKTSQVRWYSKSRVLSGSGEVLFSTPEFSVRGRGFKTDIDTQTIEIQDNVDAIFY